MTEPTRDQADPLARIGHQLIAAEQRVRWRRARRRIVGGTLAGVLLLAAVAFAAMPGGGRDEPDGPPAATLARDGGMRLEFRVGVGGATDAGAVADVARTRLATLGIAPASVSGDGGRLTVELPGATPAETARARAALDPGQLAFYDWEASAVGRDGKPVAEGLAAQRPESVRLSQGAGDPSQGFTRAQAERLRARLGKPAVVVEAVAARGAARVPANGGPARFYVLRAEPLLTGVAVVDPAAGVNDLGQPDVEFRLTTAGQRAFHAGTRRISQRGQALMLPGVEAQSVVQHFAIVLDGRLLSVASVDPQRLPDGIDGRRGAVIEGGFTRRTAEDLAALLRAGALPPLDELSARRVAPTER